LDYDHLLFVEQILYDFFGDVHILNTLP